MKKVLIAVVAVLLLCFAFAGGYLLAGGGARGKADAAAAPAKAGAAPQQGAPAKGDAEKPDTAKPGAEKTEGGKAGAEEKGKGAEAPKADAAAPPAPPPLPVRPATPVRKEAARFSIELGVFRSAENAQLFAAALAERKLPVEIVETVDAAGQTWRRVRAGAFPDRWQAEARRPEYERIAGLGGVVVEEAAAAAAQRRHHPAAAKPAGGE